MKVIKLVACVAVYTFLACCSPILFAQQTDGVGQYKGGLKVPAQQELERFVLSIPEKFGAGSLEKVYSLRNKLPPPGDQGTTNSCVAWAVGYGFMTNQVMSKVIPQGGIRDPKLASPIILSPDYLYHYCLLKEYHSTAENNAVLFDSAFSVVASNGDCVRPLMSDYKSDPSPEAITNGKVFRTMLSTSTVDPSDRHSIKAQLKRGKPLPIGAYVDDLFLQKSCRFEDAKGRPIWDRYRDSQRTGHAMLLIGWDDTQNAFEILNSFGGDWGNNKGYLWMDYDFFAQAVAVVYNCDILQPKKFGSALLQEESAVVTGGSSAYCLLGTKDERTGKFDANSLAFEINTSDLDEGKIQPGTILKRSPKVPSLNLRSQMSIYVPGRGISLSEQILGTIDTGGVFQLEELKKFTIKHGTESYYWIGGKVINGGEQIKHRGKLPE